MVILKAILLLCLPLFWYGRYDVRLWMATTILWLILKRWGESMKLSGIVLVAVVICLGSLRVNSIWTSKNSIDRERLVWNSEVFERQRVLQTKETMYLPYRLRDVVWGKSLYIYRIAGNSLRLVNVTELLDILWPVGFAGVVIGLGVMPRRWGLWLAVGLLASGMNKYPDKFYSWYMLWPVLYILIERGLKKLSKTTVVVLLILSSTWGVLSK